jgi:hypothetical protein
MNNNDTNTLRSRLLARHAAAEPQLDNLRRAVLAETPARHAADNAPVTIYQLLLAIFVLYRRLWTGLAAIWVLLLALHISQRSPATSFPASTGTELAASPDSFLKRQAQLHALLR